MKQRLSLAVALAALVVAALGVVQLGGAATHRSSTASGDLFFDAFKDITPLTGTLAAPLVVAETSVLPGGSYLISAKVVAAGRAHAFARTVCQIRYPDWTGSLATTDNASATVGGRAAAAEDQTLSLLWSASFKTPGRISLVCWPEQQVGIAPVLTDGSLAVLPVSTVNP